MMIEKKQVEEGEHKQTYVWLDAGCFHYEPRLRRETRARISATANEIDTAERRCSYSSSFMTTLKGTTWNQPRWLSPWLHWSGYVAHYRFIDTEENPSCYLLRWLNANVFFQRESMSYFVLLLKQNFEKKQSISIFFLFSINR